MADVDVDVVRREFAALTGLIEDAALIASEGQGVKNRRSARRTITRLWKATKRIKQRLLLLEVRLR